MGGLVRLGQLGTIVPGSAAAVISHDGRVRSVTINALTNGGLVGDVLRDVQTRLAGMNLPSGYTITYSGQAAQGGSAFSDIFKALGVAVTANSDDDIQERILGLFRRVAK